MKYVRVKGNYAYQHKGNRIESVEPGSVVAMQNDADAEWFVNNGMGEFAEGPEHLIRPSPDPAKEVEHPGSLPGPGKAERATAKPQRS